MPSPDSYDYAPPTPLFPPVQTGATYQDLLAAPENATAELIEGALYLQPRPRGIHQLTVKRLGEALVPAERTDGWVILPEVELHLGGNVFVPDLSGWRVERFTESLETPAFKVTPDWVCEVHSPSTIAYDRGLKRAQYLALGIQSLWLVDPAGRTVEVFVPMPGAWACLGTWAEGATLTAPPFVDTRIELGRLWTLGSAK